MLDQYRRVIDYLRISLTDRCNFRCRYCMPPQGVKLLDAKEILSYEELLRIITVLGQYGVSKIRLTGGEPLVRKGIVDFIRNIRAIKTVKDLAMTTNGSLLGYMAGQLKEAGLDRINISMDTTDSKRFLYITGRERLDDVLKGIDSALKAGLNPVKLNVVLTDVLCEQDICYFIEQVYKYPVAVRFIEYMPIGQHPVKPEISIASVKKMIYQAGYGALQPTVAVEGNGPARYYRLPRAQGVFGFITPISDHFCHKCNRIRLTADGKIKPCLLANTEMDIKAALRSGCDDQRLYELFAKTLQEKGPQHSLSGNRRNAAVSRGMSQVGG